MVARPSPKLSVKKARQELYRQIVLEAAEQVFAERGFDDAKMQEIAAKAGISLGTLYGLFEGKQELYQAIHEARGAELFVAAAQHTSDARSIIDFFRAGIAGYVRYLIERPHYLRMHLRDGRAWAIGSDFGSTVQTEQWTRGMGMIQEALRRGMDEGTFIDEDPSVLARTMIATHQVWLADWVERGMKDDPETLIRRMSDFAERAFCRPEVAAARAKETS